MISNFDLLAINLISSSFLFPLFLYAPLSKWESFFGHEGVNALVSKTTRQMRAIFSLSCPCWSSLSSSAWTSVFHTHFACLGNVHIVLPKSNLLAHIEKGDWLWGSAALRAMLMLLWFRDLKAFRGNVNISVQSSWSLAVWCTFCLLLKSQAITF